MATKTRYCLDSNVFIYPTKGSNVIIDFLGSDTHCYSVVAITESTGRKGLTYEDNRILGELFSVYEPVPVTYSIAEIAGYLRQTYKLLTPDSIMLATAYHKRLPLLTADKALTQVWEIDVVLFLNPEAMLTISIGAKFIPAPPPPSPPLTPDKPS